MCELWIYIYVDPVGSLRYGMWQYHSRTFWCVEDKNEREGNVDKLWVHEQPIMVFVWRKSTNQVAETRRYTTNRKENKVTVTRDEVDQQNHVETKVIEKEDELPTIYDNLTQCVWVYQQNGCVRKEMDEKERQSRFAFRRKQRSYLSRERKNLKQRSQQKRKEINGTEEFETSDAGKTTERGSKCGYRKLSNQTTRGIYSGVKALSTQVSTDKTLKCQRKTWKKGVRNQTGGKSKAEEIAASEKPPPKSADAESETADETARKI